MTRVMPLLFVPIWATGFIVARLIAPHAAPLTFLTIRFGLSSLAFAGLAVLAGAAWPRGGRAWGQGLIAGALMQGVYLGGVFWGVGHGVSAGLSALIAGLQPLVTALLAAPLLGERVGARRWIGIGLGFCGAVLVIGPTAGITAGPAGAVPALPLAACGAGMLGITIGTIWQKRTAAGADPRSNAAVQFIGGAIVTAPLALAAEDGRFDASPTLWLALAWAVCGLSLGAVSLLLALIRRGALAGVAALFYLVPPVTAVFAFVLFGEALSPLQIGGMALAALGVALAARAQAG